MRLRHPSFAGGTRSASLLVALGMMVAGCGDTPLVPVATDDVLLLTQEAGLETLLRSEYRGQVVLDEAGCFRLDLVPPQNATVLWPAGTTLWSRGDRLELQDARGRRIVTLGSSFRFAGGFVAALDEVTTLSAAARAASRERCPGSYWLLTPGSAWPIAAP